MSQLFQELFEEMMNIIWAVCGGGGREILGTKLEQKYPLK